jgi:hypothetical protein
LCAVVEGVTGAGVSAAITGAALVSTEDVGVLDDSGDVASG